MADVAASNDGVVSSDGSRVGCQGVGSSEKKSSGGNNSGSLPDHADNGA